MPHFNGKSHIIDKIVVVSPRHRKFELLFKFVSKSEAKAFYEKFDLDKERMLIQRIKIFFCSHREEHDLNMESDRYHYVYCPKCNRAIFVDDETEEDRKKRLYMMHKEHEETKIKNLEAEISCQQEKLKEMKCQFADRYGQSFE